MISWKKCVTVANIKSKFCWNKILKNIWRYFGLVCDGKGSTTPGWFLYFLCIFIYSFSVFIDLISSIEPNKMSNVVYTYLYLPYTWCIHLWQENLLISNWCTVQLYTFTLLLLLHAPVHLSSIHNHFETLTRTINYEGVAFFIRKLFYHFKIDKLNKKKKPGSELSPITLFLVVEKRVTWRWLLTWAMVSPFTFIICKTNFGVAPVNPNQHHSNQRNKTFNNIYK